MCFDIQEEVMTHIKITSTKLYKRSGSNIFMAGFAAVVVKLKSAAKYS
ncbi:hypothetical protein E2C01_094885 [Portunus trituberculatus]|uniref:Uncharacterized protein n=1 Tax=Portunus trituberculatus TaxID=210409 RepID=A0A5B7JND0_PORTR|nr:hypothetical protein [Portunus trituberculatus]